MSCFASEMGTLGRSSAPIVSVISMPSSSSSMVMSWIQASLSIFGPCSMPITVRTVLASSTIDPGRPVRSETTWTSSVGGSAAPTTSSTSPDRGAGPG